MGIEKLKNKRVLITGHTGFLGSNMVEKLKGKVKTLFGFSRHAHAGTNGITSYTLDLRDRNGVKKLVLDMKPDVVFHLAGSLERDPAKREEVLERFKWIFQKRN